MSAVETKNGRAPRVARQPLTDGPTSLAGALLAFHAEAPKLKRDQPGRIGSRNYMYTSLDALLDDVEPLLLKHALLWSAKVTLQDGHAAALYRMEHVPSGEYEEWVGPLPYVDPGPQNLGSAITYMRRYTLQAYLNLAPGEDDDGAAASNSAPGEEGETVCLPNARAPQRTERPATAKQQDMLAKKAKAAGLSTSQFADVVRVAQGSEGRSMEEEAAERWLAMWLPKLPASRVDAVIAGITAHKSDEVPF